MYIFFSSFIFLDGGSGMWFYCRQVYLAQSEEDREAAVGREALALSRVKELQQAIRTGEENLKHAVNDLEVVTKECANGLALTIRRMCTLMYSVCAGILGGIVFGWRNCFVYAQFQQGWL